MFENRSCWYVERMPVVTLIITVGTSSFLHCYRVAAFPQLLCTATQVHGNTFWYCF
jgi:hypothetical protein